MKVEIQYFDKDGIELDFGDILESDEYPFSNDCNINYYGIVMWSDYDGVIVRTSVGDNNRVSGSSDGNCERIQELCLDGEKTLFAFKKVGNVKNQEDVKKYLRDKTWTLEDCL